MHPAVILLATLAGLLVVQWLDMAALALLAAVLLPALRGGGDWWRWLRRSRWLLACLWLVLAYGAPGEAVAGLAWAPTYEGVAVANLHGARLVLCLGLLALLFRCLEQAMLPVALWSLLLPLRRCGVQVDRLVVRLALVLRHLADGLPAGQWQRLLSLDAVPAAGPSVLSFTCPVWRWRDGLALVAAGIFWWGMVQL